MTCLCGDGSILNVHTLEAHAIEAALTRARGDKTRAAKLLGISPKTLYTKIDRLGLRDRKWKEDKPS